MLCVFYWCGMFLLYQKVSNFFNKLPHQWASFFDIVLLYYYIYDSRQFSRNISYPLLFTFYTTSVYNISFEYFQMAQYVKLKYTLKFAKLNFKKQPVSKLWCLHLKQNIGVFKKQFRCLKKITKKYCRFHWMILAKKKVFNSTIGNRNNGR